MRSLYYLTTRVWLLSAVTGVSNSEADTWTWLARPRVLRDLTAGLGLRLETVSGHEEAVEDCDMTEDEAEGGVRASCFPARINNVTKILRLETDYP